MSALVEEIEGLFATRGQAAYGETVTQAQHALQVAQWAEAEGAPPALVAAALLHDIGHLIERPDDAFGHHGHAATGGAWLARRFPKAVAEPVRLHVAAKRYLCAVEAGYADRLSPASVHSLARQGGPMSDAEARAFEAEPFHAEALRLRRWDEAGKRADAEPPGFAHYRALLEALAAAER